MSLHKSDKPSVCILDAFTTQPGDLNWDSLNSLGKLEVFDRTSPDQILERARKKEILIINKVVVTREILSQLPDCKLICLLSTGTNAVDLEACKERKIPVCNIPAYSTDSVAEMVFALLLAWARGVMPHAEAVQQGVWTRHNDFCFTLSPQVELKGKTLGLVGFGDIAQAVARIAGAFGLEVIAYTPHPEGKPDLGQRFVSLDEIFSCADILSLHCPLTHETEQMIHEARLSEMKKGAVLINTGRGGLLDEHAVASSLTSGHLGAALLDVLSTEPPKADNPLLNAPRAWITPHIAWATRAARSRLIEILTGNVEAFLKGKPQNVVNGL
ncbi:D-2-hydroxyacid dehydrogenase [Kiritimatiellaeota bacterium B1221]|nr:D-2-hydroxyacid dehydrogenase [Kiritimatiellaeota bacterium B1221]